MLLFNGQSLGEICYAFYVISFVLLVFILRNIL